MPAKQPRRPMLMVQMSEENKAILRRAAELEGYTELAVWVRSVTLERARQILTRFAKAV